MSTDGDVRLWELSYDLGQGHRGEYRIRNVDKRNDSFYTTRRLCQRLGYI